MKRALSLTALLALGAWLGCAVDRSGLQTQAASPGGGGDSLSPMGGAAAVGGAPGLGEDSVGASGNAGAPGSEAGAGLGGELSSGGTVGSEAGAGAGGEPSSGGTVGSDAGVGAGGELSSGGTVGSDAGVGAGGEPSSGGSVGSGGTPIGGGTSGSDAGEGSDRASGGSEVSSRDAGSGSNDGARSDATPGSDAGFDSRTSPNWHLVWWDEFNLGQNAGVDTEKWTVAASEPGTVNGEQQKYTARPQNIFYDDQGHLVLRGLHDSWESNGRTYPYTSGRLQTGGNSQFKFGRVEVRAKLPAGQGSFPGIVLMGTTGNWPQCGEIGIMEQWGRDKSWLYCSTYSGTSSDINQKVTFPNTTTLSSDFHVYALEWYSDHMVFFIDDVQVARSNFDTTSPFYTGTYYLILDVAIGGTMGGTIDDVGGFPMDMVLDYVRVYAQQP